jgi:hypothetical protein
MNVIDFVGVMPDGRQEHIYTCGKCGHYSTNRDLVERCCCCSICGKEIPQQGMARQTYHDECWKNQQEEKIRRLIENAVKLDSWNGWVYWEGTGHNDGYFASLDEFLEWLDDEGKTERPEFVFACTEIPFKAPSLNHLIEMCADDMYEDAADDLKGLEELQAALDAFQKANEKLIAYTPDYKRMVRVPEEAAHAAS